MGLAKAGRMKFKSTRIGFLGLALMLVIAQPLRGDQAPEIAEGTRALYQGDFEKARTLALEYFEGHPESAEAQVLLARAELSQGQFEPAYEALRKSLDLDPGNINALYYLEKLCVILSQTEFQRLLVLAPDSLWAHQLRAESYLARHQNNEAENEFRAALKSRPDSVTVLDALGELLRLEFKFDEALEFYARAAKLAPRDYTSAYGSGVCHLYKQNYQRAIESFHRALQIDPKSAAARLALGDALLRANQAKAAVAELRAALSLGPNMRQAYTLLGRAYQKLGQTREAEQALQKERELEQAEINARQMDDELSPSTQHQPERPLNPELRKLP
jgi:Tfp pilus assembly protein PilF